MSKFGKESAKQLIAQLPEEFQKNIIVLASATMEGWELLSEEEREEYDNNPEVYLGRNLLMASLLILEDKI
jgi:hypothetical protein